MNCGNLPQYFRRWCFSAARVAATNGCIDARNRHDTNHRPQMWSQRWWMQTGKHTSNNRTPAAQCDTQVLVHRRFKEYNQQSFGIPKPTAVSLITPTIVTQPHGKSWPEREWDSSRLLHFYNPEDSAPTMHWMVNPTPKHIERSTKLE